MHLRSLKRWRRAPARILEGFRAMCNLRNWVRVTLQYAGLQQYRAGLELITRSGVRLKTRQPAELVTGWVVWVRGEYEVPEGTKTVVDVGANIGAFTLLAGEKGAQRIVAVEPSRETCALLLENLARNGLNERVHVIQAAIGGRNGTGKLLLAADSPMTRLCPIVDAAAGAQEVTIMTLEVLLDKCGMQRVDLLKMDCEGAEYEALRACSRESLDRIERIVLEYHPNGDHRELVKLLHDARFRLVRHRVNGRGTGILEFAR